MPLLLNIGFTANSATIDDPGIKPGEIWSPEKNVRVPATVRPQGRLNVAPFLAQGIGVATIYYGDIEPDFAEGLPHGVRKRFLTPEQTQPAPDEWGAIGVALGRNPQQLVRVAPGEFLEHRGRRRPLQQRQRLARHALARHA